MGSLSLSHWLIVLAIVLMVFGTKRLRGLGSDVGGAIRGFRSAMQGTDDKPAPPSERSS
jgi:sec-independent protein translocase protein TatA